MHGDSLPRSEWSVARSSRRWSLPKRERASLANLTKLDELFTEWQNDQATYETAFFAEVKRKIDGFIGGRIARDREDVVQTALIKVWRTIPSFNSEKANLSSWLRIITNSAVIDQLRKNSREDEVLCDLGVEVGDDEEVKEVTIDDIVGHSATSASGWPTWNTWTRSGLMTLFDHDEELVDALLQSANLAHVEKLTGRTRKSVRHAVKMAQRRYAEIYETMHRGDF